MLKLNQKQTDGFTLVELLIVVAIIGIIAAIAIPNLLSAIQRGKQKRTMGDIKTLGTALEAYQTDANAYIPAAAAPAITGNAAGTAGVAPLWGGGAANLDPDYQRIPIFKDGWWSSQTPAVGQLRYGTVVVAALSVDYILCSLGKNSAAAADPVAGAAPAGCAAIGLGPYSGGEGTTFDCDIVLVDGQFNQQPSGKQRNIGGC